MIRALAPTGATRGGLLADQPAHVIAARVRLAESVGLDFVGITDGQMILARRLRLPDRGGPPDAARRARAVGHQPVDPTVTASAICTLDEPSAGRALLGISAGDDSVKTINAAPARHEDLAEPVDRSRRLARGDVVKAQPHDLSLASSRPAAPPIYWAGASRRSFGYGARYADGVIDTGWPVPDMLSDAIRWIDEGADAAGRSRSAVAKIFNSGLAVSDDGSKARNDAKTYASKGLMYKRGAEVPGWSESQRQALIRAYDYSQHLATGQKSIDLVPEELITKKALAGTPAEVVELLGMVIRAGYAHIAVVPLGDVDATIRAFGEILAPRIR